MKERSRALPHFYYGDPADVAERLQAQSCHGCSHSHRAYGREWCDKGRPHGKKCRFYKLKDVSCSEP